MRPLRLVLLLLVCAPLCAQKPAAQDAAAQREIQKLDSVAKLLRNSDFEQSVALSRKAINLAAAKQLPNPQVTALLTLSRSFRNKSLFDSALVYADSAHNVAFANKLEKRYAYIYDHQGLIYMRQSNYNKAVACFYKTIEYGEKAKDDDAIREGFNHLGVVAFYRNDYMGAIKFYRKALEFTNKEKDLRIYVSGLDNIGIAFSNLNQIDSALAYQQIAAQQAPQLNDSNFLAEVYINLSSTLLRLNQFERAAPYIDTAFAIHTKLQNEYGILLANNYRARLLHKSGRAQEAAPYAETAYALAVKLNIPEQIKETSTTLTDVYVATGDYKKAIFYYEILTSIMVEINKEENAKAIQELSVQYETEKQQQQIELLTRDKLLKDERIQADRRMKWFIGAVALMLLGVSGVFIYRFVEKKKANRLLEEKNAAIASQKSQIEVQKYELEQRNKETTDSIHYARRIQSSVLPSAQLMQRLLPGNFIYFRPKDIVSGDFYWVNEKQTEAGGEKKSYIYFAVADCTGHGVPGAMMAMLGSSLLNRIVSTPELLLPGDVLNELHRQLVKAMNENASQRDSSDGMDIALLMLDREEKKLWYAGAGRSLYYRFANEPVQHIAHQKRSIGDELHEAFQTHSLLLHKPLQLWLFTDGIADQFGGPKGKKFMARQLVQLLEQMSETPFAEQLGIFSAAFEAWKEGYEQTDDVTLAGIELC
jgi:serine phosphatase RsbU (regulator of sigma subunit)